MISFHMEEDKNFTSLSFKLLWACFFPLHMKIYFDFTLSSFIRNIFWFHISFNRKYFLVSHSLLDLKIYLISHFFDALRPNFSHYKFLLLTFHGRTSPPTNKSKKAAAISPFCHFKIQLCLSTYIYWANQTKAWKLCHMQYLLISSVSRRFSVVGRHNRSKEKFTLNSFLRLQRSGWF